MKPPYLAYKITILGHPWTVLYCTDKHFKKEHGPDILGACELEDKEIWLRVKKLKPEVITHELVHAYFEEICTTPAGLDTDQLEEIAADLFAKYGRRILEQTDKILNAYEVLKERSNAV